MRGGLATFAKLGELVDGVFKRARIVPKSTPGDVRAESEEHKRAARNEVSKVRLEMLLELRRGGLGGDSRGSSGEREQD